VRRLVIVVLVLLVGVALVIGLKPMTPARTADDYAHKAKDTAQSVLSSVQTARLAARAGSRGDAFGPYVSVMLSESEDAVSKAHDSFDRVQPPDEWSDRTRTHLGRLLDRSSQLVSELRISARRGEIARLERQARPLRPLATQLERFIEDPGPAPR
jgi:type II secretory pathway pseudopilin PulG